MGWRGAAGSACGLCSCSKHVLGSHEYIQHCRKFDIDIRLQLMKRKGVRSDLARTVGARVGGGGTGIPVPSPCCGSTHEWPSYLSTASLHLQANDDQSPSTLNHYIHLQERPIKQTISR